jgi:hypothetical protein
MLTLEVIVCTFMFEIMTARLQLILFIMDFSCIRNLQNILFSDITFLL